MANNVFANGREIACKAGSGKVIAAFPDVCFTPPDKVPPTPPGVPVPYPVTSLASDTNKGTKKVVISRKEVMKRDASNFKKCTGDNAAQTQKKGIINSKITGKVLFVSWSMDVKIEAKNAVRHLDTTTSNHSSPNANAAMPWTYLDRLAMGNIPECAQEKSKAESECGDLNKKMQCPPSGGALAKARKKNSNTSAEGLKKLEKQLSADLQSSSCHRAMRCFLTPYKPNKCCPGQTPDHLIDVKTFVEAGEDRSSGKRKAGWSKYDDGAAPSMCVEGHAAAVSTHGVLSAKRKAFVQELGGAGTESTLEIVAMVGAITAADTFKGCSAECLEAQLLNYHRSVQENDAEVTLSEYGIGAGSSEAGKRGVSERAARLAKDWLTSN